MDADSLEAQYAMAELKRGQVICQVHGIQWAYDSVTSKPDPRGACGKCIIEVRSGEFTACPTHGIQPAKEGGRSCALCDLIGLSLEAGPPALSEAEAVPSIGVPDGGLGRLHSTAQGESAGAEAPGDRGPGGRGAGPEGGVFPPPLQGDAGAGAGREAAASAATHQAAPAREAAQPGKRAPYRGKPE
jgi:hypothetical protein